MNTITAKQIKLTRAMPGYYVHSNAAGDNLFHIVKNSLGMWRITRVWATDGEWAKESIIAQTLKDARAFIAARY